MTTNDSKPLVLVTGATGYIAGHCIRELLEHGYRVRGTVRSLSDPTKTEHLRRMAFRVNWKASYDFPYMGMFLPPAAPDEVWTNFRGMPTSQQSLEAYCARMRAMAAKNGP